MQNWGKKLTILNQQKCILSGSGWIVQNWGKKRTILNQQYFEYLRARIQNLFHVPLYVLNKSACILSDAAFVEALPVAWELLRYLQLTNTQYQFWWIFSPVRDELIICAKLGQKK